MFHTITSGTSPTVQYDDYGNRNYRDMIFVALIKNQIDSTSDSYIIPQISSSFNEICINKTSITLDYPILKSSSVKDKIGNLFIRQGSGSYSDSLNWSVIFNLFKNVNKVHVEDLIFNDFLCEDFVSFINSDNGSIEFTINAFCFRYHPRSANFSGWIKIAKKYSSQMKQSGWLMTAAPPKQLPDRTMDKGRVSFIKRMKQKVDKINNKPYKPMSKKEKISHEVASLKEMIDKNIKLRQKNNVIQQIIQNLQPEINGTENDINNEMYQNTESNFKNVYKKIYEFKIYEHMSSQTLDKQRAKMDSRRMIFETEYNELKEENDSLKTLLTKLMKEKDNQQTEYVPVDI